MSFCKYLRDNFVWQKFNKWLQSDKQLLNMANNVDSDVDGQLSLLNVTSTWWALCRVFWEASKDCT